MNEELKQFINNSGGIFDSSLLSAALIAELLQVFDLRMAENLTFAKTIYTQSTRSVKFLWINSLATNAYALAISCPDDEETDQIIMNIGVPVILLDIFMKMLSDPTLFEGIGDVSKEVAGRYVCNPIDEIYDNPEKTFVFPKCNARKLYAIELALLATDFVFFHELAHLYRGHQEYKAISNINVDFSETSTGNDNLAEQALELDADLIGIKFIWRLMSHRAKNFKETSLGYKSLNTINSAYFAVYGSPDLGLRALSISVYLYFRMFAKPWEPADALVATHPSDTARMLIVFGDFFLKYGSEVHLGETQFKTFMASNLSVVEKALATLQNMAGLRQIHSLIENSGDFSKYIEVLLASRNDLIPILAPHMRGSDFFK